jgi:hypothetical protein
MTATGFWCGMPTYAELGISPLMPSTGLCRPGCPMPWSEEGWPFPGRHNPAVPAALRGCRGTLAGCRADGSGPVCGGLPDAGDGLFLDGHARTTGWSPGPGPLDGPPVQPHPEPVRDLVGQLAGAGVGGADELHNLRAQLHRAAPPAPLVEQPRHACLRERRQHQVERRARIAVRRGGAGSAGDSVTVSCSFAFRW